jgi:hypothetical protein
MSLVVILPFILTGRVAELISLPITISSVMPVVSADAHNFWRLALDARGVQSIFIPDADPLLGPLTYRLAAAVLVAAQFALTTWLYWTRRVSLAEACALGALGWFLFTTQAHENHLFFALPLLAIAWPERRWLLVPYVVLSTTVLLNMVLHDLVTLEALGINPGDTLVQRLRVLNAGVNLVCFAGWSLVAATGRWRPVRTMPPGDRVPPASSPSGSRAASPSTPPPADRSPSPAS